MGFQSIKSYTHLYVYLLPTHIGISQTFEKTLFVSIWRAHSLAPVQLLLILVIKCRVNCFCGCDWFSLWVMICWEHCIRDEELNELCCCAAASKTTISWCASWDVANTAKYSRLSVSPTMKSVSSKSSRLCCVSSALTVTVRQSVLDLLLWTAASLCVYRFIGLFCSLCYFCLTALLLLALFGDKKRPHPWVVFNISLKTYQSCIFVLDSTFLHHKTTQVVYILTEYVSVICILLP